MDNWDGLDDQPKDECGVFGVWAPGEEVAKLAYFGLYALQHRGHESAGIAVADGERIIVFKDSRRTHRHGAGCGLAAVGCHYCDGCRSGFLGRHGAAADRRNRLVARMPRHGFVLCVVGGNGGGERCRAAHGERKGGFVERHARHFHRAVVDHASDEREGRHSEDGKCFY